MDLIRCGLMANHPKKLWVYNRKEVGILLLLAVGVSVLSFTFGVHLGKKVSKNPSHAESAAVESADHAQAPHLESTPAQNPSRNEVSKMVEDASQSADDALDESLKEEIVHSGMKLNEPRAVDLPTETKSEKSAVEKPAAETHAATSKKESTHSAKTSSTPYALQLGSFPSADEAQKASSEYEEKGISVVIQETEIKNKGKWFRLIYGNFPSPRDAQSEGSILKSKNLIGSYVVIKNSLKEAKK